MRGVWFRSSGFCLLVGRKELVDLLLGFRLSADFWSGLTLSCYENCLIVALFGVGRVVLGLRFGVVCFMVT